MDRGFGKERIEDEFESKLMEGNSDGLLSSIIKFIKLSLLIAMSWWKSCWLKLTSYFQRWVHKCQCSGASKFCMQCVFEPS